jgi:hypothetical protein
MTEFWRPEHIEALSIAEAADNVKGKIIAQSCHIQRGRPRIFGTGGLCMEAWTVATKRAAEVAHMTQYTFFNPSQTLIGKDLGQNPSFEGVEFLVSATDGVDAVAARTHNCIRIGFPNICSKAVDIRHGAFRIYRDGVWPEANYLSCLASKKQCRLYRS